MLAQEERALAGDRRARLRGVARRPPGRPRSAPAAGAPGAPAWPRRRERKRTSSASPASSRTRARPISRRSSSPTSYERQGLVADAIAAYGVAQQNWPGAQTPVLGLARLRALSRAHQEARAALAGLHLERPADAAGALGSLDGVTSAPRPGACPRASPRCRRASRPSRDPRLARAVARPRRRAVTALPQFRASVDVVRIEALVLDRGRPIAGLGADDFTVTDNGDGADDQRPRRSPASRSTSRSRST